MFSHFDHITVFIKIRLRRKGKSLEKIKYSLPRISSVKCYHPRKAKNKKEKIKEKLQYSVEDEEKVKVVKFQ